MTQLIITGLILMIPLLISLMEQKNRKDQARQAMKKVRQRQDEPQAPAPKAKPSLADWIEDLKQKQDLTSSMDPAASSRKRVLDPLEEPALEMEWDDDDEFDVEPVEPPPLSRQGSDRPWEDPKNYHFQETAAEAIARERAEKESLARNAARTSLLSAPRAKAASRAARAQRVDFHAALTPQDMKRAVILREILDKPLALRERR
ncbi:MAG: hypothetical protein V3W41_20670 [Planctomycetota bacterium]